MLVIRVDKLVPMCVVRELQVTVVFQIADADSVSQLCPWEENRHSI